MTYYDPIYNFYYNTYPLITFVGFDYTNPTNVESSNRFDPNFKSPLIDELVVQYERALSDDMAISFQGIYKRNSRLLRRINIWSDGTLESKNDWALLGTDPETGGEAWGQHPRRSHRRLLYQLPGTLPPVPGRSDPVHQKAVQQVDGRPFLHLRRLV